MSKPLKFLIINLRAQFQTTRYTQVQIAEMVGVPQAYISQILCGRIKNPSLEHIDALAKAFGTTVGALFTDPEEDVPVTPHQSWLVLRSFLDNFFFIYKKAPKEWDWGK